MILLSSVKLKEHEMKRKLNAPKVIYRVIADIIRALVVALKTCPAFGCFLSLDVKFLKVFGYRSVPRNN